ncbi:arginase family protein [Nocardioides sp. 1609]|uniref:arginase family protein n=1 Tax=Nocardioides sp. 1609 TaxID=2508327 RepID=UPI0014315548|nr:arginase family protein [Nocardioides sp. 1609]
MSQRTGMFGAPVTDLASALRSGADFVVVGAPYDHGASYRPGSRFGPEALRRVSTTVHRLDDDLRGSYDIEQGRRLMENVGVLDIGDLLGTLGDLGRDVLDALEDTVAALAAAGATPMVLGGDHSITLRVVDGLTRHHEQVGVLHLDAHYDHGAVRTGPRDAVHHGNFLDWVVGNPRVACLAQFGIRQLVPDPPEASATVLRWPGRSALSIPPAEIVAALPPDLVWHISLDVDVLDPTVMPSTGTVLPGGWTYNETVDLLGGLADLLPIVGVDVVELLPGPDEAPAITISALLLRLMDRIARSNLSA